MAYLRRTLGIVTLAALCVVALALGCFLRGVLPGLATGAAVAQEVLPESAPEAASTPEAGAETPPETAAAAAGPEGTPAPDPGPQAVAQMVTADGRVTGRVVLGSQTVIETRSMLDGLGPYERASVAAARINLAREEKARPGDFQAIEREGRWLVVAGDRIIISVAPTEGDETEADTARRWATNIALALHQALGTKPGSDVPIPPALVDAREDMIEGGRVGVVLIDGLETLRIVAAAPGLTPFERAQVVANRVRKATDEGALPQDVRADTLYGMEIVKVKDTLLITVAPADAEAAKKTPRQLAQAWAQALSEALARHYSQAAGPALANQEWQPKEPYDDKWVPIISVLEGVRIGLARVNGPSSKVKLVQAVAQLETHWKRNLEIDIYVPISTKVPGKTLDRVQACAVTGLADIRL